MRKMFESFLDEYANNIKYPICLSIAYILMIFTCKSDRWNIPKWILSTWNIFLSVYSGISLYLLFPIIKYWLTNLSSIDDFACQEHRHLFDPNLNFRNIVHIFCLSKTLELIDTFFIVTRNRYPIFLHWFHHLLTLWYCWYAFIPCTLNGYFFCAMNLFVHSIMYMYYGIVGYLPFIKVFGPFLTIIQTSQMLLGSTILVYQLFQIHFNSRPVGKYEDAHIFKPELPKETCHVIPEEVYFASFMYFVYLYLFGKFLVNIIKNRWCGSNKLKIN